jgi:hypothetical protein
MTVGVSPGAFCSDWRHLFNGQQINSDSINILVERADSPMSFSIYPTVTDFTLAQKRYLQVTALYAETTADSRDPAKQNMAQARPALPPSTRKASSLPSRPGVDKITVNYRDLKHDVPLRVRENER